MAEMTYRQAITEGIAQEMERDESVLLIGEDVGAAGHVFKTTVGLFERFGPTRVRDTPISEQAIVGAAMGAAMTGLRPIVSLMYADFLGVCWDMVANEVAKTPYMTNGQITLPMVIQCDNGGGLHKGAQHSQSLENWAMAVPGLKVVAPSCPQDVVGLMAAAVRDPDPVMVFHHKSLYSMKGEVGAGEQVDELGRAAVVRRGGDATVVALAAMVPRAIAAAERLSRESGIEVGVVDLRSLVPLDMTTVADELRSTGRLFTVEENPRLLGWGAEITSIIAEELFFELDGPITRITAPHVPLPAAAALENLAIPSVERITETIREGLKT